MRIVPLALVLVAAPAAADTFGGFSAVDRPYLVNSDRVCAPLTVTDGAASGVPACEQAAADVVANLTIKEAAIQRGAKAEFAATVAGKTLTVTNASGDALVKWNAPDPIGKVVEVYATEHGDRVAVKYTVRRLGKEVTDVVAFEIVKTTGRDPKAGTGTGSGSATATATAAAAGTAAAPVDPKITKAVEAANKAKTLGAWQAVTAIDPQHSEALFRIAALQAGKHKDRAIAALVALAATGRGDAIEWLVDARFDPAFAGLRADPKFRGAVGLDRKAATPYERLMGFGGQWEQTGTSCDQPEVRLNVTRERTFTIRIKTNCEGQIFATQKHGTWRVDADGIVLTVPTKGQAASAKDDAPCKFEGAGDEDKLHCSLGRDLDFVVLPTRR